ncbi:MAG: dephospho-CoA kinase [Gammaproteobacteria bacterium]|nr:MAG: dephospho-CoA kinase [Gammaproteobacteria bacterium]
MRPLRIGLTGGIASGKTTVARHFAALGATVIDTDQLAREVVEPGRPALAALVDALGAGILDASGRLDRRRLRDRIFADTATRRVVGNIVHPAIHTELRRQVETAGGPYQMLVIPLLVEGGRRPELVDRVLVVDCPEEQQLERLIRRDGETRESALRALSAQASRAQRLAAADEVIDNTGDEAGLAARVAELDRHYRELAAAIGA